MRLINTLLLLLSTVFVTAQSLPVVHSNTRVVDVQVGEVRTAEWGVNPNLTLDPFTHNVLGEKVTFYTDVDSISAKVSTTPFDFIILLNGKDSAFTRIVYEQSKLDVLKEAAAYEDKPNTAIPAFTYQDAASPPLQELRQKYNLDSIAGQGNDVSQMLNLMRWVHNTIEHNGNKPNLGEQNADQFISSCREGKGTLNCRGLGITLNEVYLAMGFPSRFVTCMPRDTNDFDCHVINTAFSRTLNKWIWLDPTQNGYVMNEGGELLGFAEVRERLINDQPLIVNPDANWNYRSTTDKAWYLEYYMAKNLYKFSTSLHSTYDYESRGEGKKIINVELWPAGRGEHLPARSEITSKDGTTTITYRTRNPEQFWTPPAAVK